MISLLDVQRGYDRWAAKPHNAKWVRRIDGTPIANDIVVNIFDELKDIVQPAPADLSVGADPIGYCVWISPTKLAACAKTAKGAFPVYAEALSASPLARLLIAAKPYVEDRLHRLDGEIDGSVSKLLSDIDAALSTATPETKP